MEAKQAENWLAQGDANMRNFFAKSREGQKLTV